MSTSRKITKCKNLVERNIRGQHILVPLKTGPARLDALYTLNETAGLIWEAIQTETTEDSLVTLLSSTYDVAEVTARRDVERILDELGSIGAVTLGPGPAAE